ncbi:hypothetical protein AB0I81_50645 [Nonomuraea sp. NPDC050404]|uniref:hypothetical protein n=1 Tax=Nonomuraea sp. NPDC050404 TaxID=3155783 RepID=UPI0033FA65DB
MVVDEAAAFVRPAVESAGERGAAGSGRGGGAGSERARLEAYIRASLGFAAARPEHARALRQIVCNTDERVAEEWLRGLFECGQRAGAFRVFDPELMSTVLNASIDGVADRLDPGTCADALVELFDRATRAGLA